VAFERHRIKPAAESPGDQPDPAGLVPHPREGDAIPALEYRASDTAHSADLDPLLPDTANQDSGSNRGPSGDGSDLVELDPVPAPTPVPETASDHAGHRLTPWPTARQQIAAGIVVLCIGMAIFLIGHRFLPDIGGLGSLIETWLPWFAVPAVILLLAAAAVRSGRALVAAGLVAAVWAGTYGPMLLPRGAALTPDLRILSEDVNGSPVELAAMGPLAAAQHADLVAVEDIDPSMQASPATVALNSDFQYKSTEYEFGLWSRYKILNSTPESLGTAPDSGSDNNALAADATHVVIGALRVTLEMSPGVDLVVYVVHIPQPILGDQGFAKTRDAAVSHLVAIIAADHAPQLAVVGNLNVAATDREFSEFTSTLDLTSAQAAAGRGFGFTWPAEFPMVRLDDVLTRDITPVRSVVLPALQGGQTHLPIEVDLHFA
jgi:vancomycin resistance protein VanJ